MDFRIQLITFAGCPNAAAARAAIERAPAAVKDVASAEAPSPGNP